MSAYLTAYSYLSEIAPIEFNSISSFVNFVRARVHLQRYNGRETLRNPTVGHPRLLTDQARSRRTAALTMTGSLDGYTNYSLVRSHLTELN